MSGRVDARELVAALLGRSTLSLHQVVGALGRFADAVTIPGDGYVLIVVRNTPREGGSDQTFVTNLKGVDSVKVMRSLVEDCEARIAAGDTTLFEYEGDEN